MFARYLKGLAALVDPGSGWYGIFWQRDPEGMRACLDGTEIPPWDVVESMLQDLAGVRGTQFAQTESVRARELHAASAQSHDRLPGGREALEERLELMLREEAYATGRADELLRRLAGEPEGSAAAERLAHELEWTRDDYARATARVSELRARHAALRADAAQAAGPEHSPEPDEWSGFAARTAHEAPGIEADGWRGPGERPGSGYGTGAAQQPGAPAAPEYEASGPAPGAIALPDDWFRPQPTAPHDGPHAHADPPAPQAEAANPHPGPAPTAPTALAAGKKKRRPRGARFAGVEGSGEEAAAVPVLPVVGDTPRGARFGGAPAEQQAPTAPEPPAGARQAARDTVATLGRLRAEGRSGEAHAVLCEAAARPAPWLPVLAAELHRAGLAADWTTLLWEAASQSALRLAAAAGALAAAGRTEDSRRLLRQGVTRPADDIAAAVLALEDEGRESEARALLTAFVQLHSAEDTVGIADRDPRRLVPQLLDAARTISTSHERDLVHALRVAGHIGA
ncbi:hypothetical protein [Streptomyces sp. SLBN-118]|uniref:hypothetical protein n=1 Tax=Streptomyces sp. SLBN-118 TaxID=2768454 RepID=UPI0028C4A96F|nr:hypothetical protein [Streptomyces sp. SLBN-118]